MTFGIAVAEQSGLIMALMKKTVLGAPAYLVTYIICIVGVCANIASDAGIVFAPAIGGAVFYALGRHPIAGIMAGYVAAYGGFSANLMVVGTDALLAGITGSVMTSFGITAPVHPLMNWYVMAASTLVIALIVTLITEKIITPILGEFDPVNPELMIEDKNDFAVTEREVKGLKAAGIASVIYLIVLLLLTVPKSGFLRNDSGGLLPSSPLISGILFLLFAFFLATGITYGKVVGTIKSGADIARFMQSGLVGVAGFLVVCLPASMFITWFGKSNIATIMAIKGAELLKSLNLSSIPILILYVLLCGLIDLFITSGSSKWILIAPIFVPMLAILGLSPATTQMGYRIADSTFDIISPVSAYIPVVLGMMEKYRSKNQNLGVGTVISLCMPYSIILTIFWIALLCIWVFLGIPLGPGVSPFM
jgi:aminobenzoyl-glutamate transport protein